MYEAEAIKDFLFLNWTLTGRLAKDTTADTERPVFFFSREQLKDKIESKAIEVIKSTPLVIEKNTEFYTNETDEFLLRVIYKLQGTTRADWDISESDVELMEREIEDILHTIFNPQAGVGVFFTSNFVWSDNDEINLQEKDPYIVRELRISLTRIISRTPKTFNTFNRAIIFNVAASENMDNPPVADRNYTEVFDVTVSQGHRVREYDVTSNPNGIGVPVFFAGRYSGLVLMKSYFTEDDIGNDASNINQMYRRQNNGELITVALIHAYANNAGKILTETTLCLVTDIAKPNPAATIKTWELSAKILKPTIESVI